MRLSTVPSPPSTHASQAKPAWLRSPGSRRPALVAWVCGVSLVVGLAGCSTNSDSGPGAAAASVPAIPAEELARLRGQFFLSSAPSEVQPITEAKRVVEEKPEVVLKGRINAGKHDPWEPGKATFVITEAAIELTAHDKDPNHDSDNCPFCKRRKSAAEATAIVQFVDDKGEVLAVDAQQLLDARKDQLVFVRGAGQVNGLGTLVVNVQGIYVQR
jgi:hypothetical protein